MVLFFMVEPGVSKPRPKSCLGVYFPLARVFTSVNLVWFARVTSFLSGSPNHALIVLESLDSVKYHLDMVDMAPTSLAYAAGLMDGEGTITLSKDSKHHEFRRPTVSVPSTTVELVEYMKAHFGGGTSNKRRSKPHHTPSKTWRITCHNALHFLAAILPYMKEPEKIRRSKLLVEEYLSVTSRNGKYSDELRVKKQDFERRFFA